MFKKTTIVAIGLSTLLCGTAQAEKGYYGVGLAFLNYSEEDIEDASLTSIYGRLGTNFNENISGEFRIGVGVGDDSVDVYGYDVDIELDNMVGAYLRGGIPVTESFFPYAVLGYTRLELTASAMGFSESESETDISFGLGADVDVNGNITVNVEYINYVDKDGLEIDGFSIGVASKF